MFWADKIVEEIAAKRQPPYAVYDWFTPSGKAHAGHLRTVLLHQAIYRGLMMSGFSATYHYGFDDMDPMDGLPSDVPADFRRYLGIPLFRVPSPVDGYASFAGYYAAKYLEAMEDLEIFPEVPKTSQMYLDGEFNPAITIVLDNASKIREIYAKLGAPRPDDWHPFQVVCEQCGRIATTYVDTWDGATVGYRCLPDLVKWARGCGHAGRISPYNGNGKIHWKVEWPAKWFLLKVAYEGGGKDHFTKGSSRDYGRCIVREVFSADEPIGYPHEFFLIGGKKMSSSRGLGMSANDAANIFPPKIMRFFVYHLPPNRQLEFTPEGETIPRIFDAFDRALAATKTAPASPEARAIAYAIQADPPWPEYTMRFSQVAFLIQMPHLEIATLAKKDKGQPLTKADAADLTERIEYARRWLDTFASPEQKFVLQPTLPAVDLSDDQRHFLANVAEGLEKTEWRGAEIHQLLHETKNLSGLASPRAFSAIYGVFLAKEFGPQLGWFLAALDKTFVISRLREAGAPPRHDAR